MRKLKFLIKMNKYSRIKLVKNIQNENDFVIFKLIHYKFKFPYN
jgi:hypothetical protein